MIDTQLTKRISFSNLARITLSPGVGWWWIRIHLTDQAHLKRQMLEKSDLQEVSQNISVIWLGMKELTESPRSPLVVIGSVTIFGPSGKAKHQHQH